MPVDQLSEADLPALQQLALACLAADGGLPAFADFPLLRARLLREETLAIREGGRLLAAAGLTRRDDRATTSGLVTPSARRQGLGAHLMAWAEDGAGDAALTVATETCSADAERLYALHGLVCTFAESVLRHDLVALPIATRPQGITVVQVAAADPADLFAAYVHSFAERPDFVQPTAREWLGELAGDEDWRRDVSVVALAEDGTPAGFVNVIGRWLDQVGVVPAWRGRNLGTYLIARTLHALAGEGIEPVGLTVNVNNRAADLYRRLGFVDAGTRARYTRPALRRA
jgi:GNAT superfamily N-acetyltransferase